MSEAPITVAVASPLSKRTQSLVESLRRLDALADEVVERDIAVAPALPRIPAAVTTVRRTEADHLGI